jgi:UDP-2-acetamido-3-amino-2,3-dideoxy-glucuronate N-acetyltransferase
LDLLESRARKDGYFLWCKDAEFGVVALKKKCSICIAGIGYWGSKLLREYESLSNCEIDSVVEAREFDLENVTVYKDYRMALNDPFIEALHIALPNEVHYRVAKDALLAGKDVLVEKPMCMNVREADELEQIARKTGRILHVGHLFLYTSTVRELGKLLSGKKIYYIEASWSTRMAPPDNRDVLFDLGSHPIDSLRHILRRRVNSVYAIGRNQENPEAGEEYVHIILDWGGIPVTVKLSWVEAGPKQRVVKIVCSDCTIEADFIEEKIVTKKLEHTSEHSLPKVNTIKEEITMFLTSIRTRKPEAPNEGKYGVETTRILSAARESLVAGEKITI